jgi:hypothetical protein
MNRSRSPHRRDSRQHSHRSRSPHRSHKHESSSRRSRSPNHHRPSDRRRSPSPPSARRRSGGHSGRRSSNRSDSSDGSRERERRHSFDDRSSRSARDRNASPDRSGRSGHYDRRNSGSDSRAGDRTSSSTDVGRSRQSRWESEPVAPAPPPSTASSAVLQPRAPSPIAEKPSQTMPTVAPADSSDALKLQFAAPAVPLQPAQMTRIYVGNVYRELSEDEIQTVFEAFGPIRSCKFIPNPENGVGKHKGFGFIDYVDPAAAASAVQAMNGFTLAVRALVTTSPFHLQRRLLSHIATTCQPYIYSPQGRAVKVGWAHSASLSASSSVDLQHVAAMCDALHSARQALQTHAFFRAAAAAAALVNKQNGL